MLGKLVGTELVETLGRDMNGCASTDGNEARLWEAQEHLIDGRTAARLAKTFKALSDPTRMRIISME